MLQQFETLEPVFVTDHDQARGLQDISNFLQYLNPTAVHGKISCRCRIKITLIGFFHPLANAGPEERTIVPHHKQNRNCGTFHGMTQRRQALFGGRVKSGLLKMHHAAQSVFLRNDNLLMRIFRDLFIQVAPRRVCPLLNRISVMTRGWQPQRQLPGPDPIPRGKGDLISLLPERFLVFMQAELKRTAPRAMCAQM
ncbi:hypothetical protein [Tritonibacter scottomollicae]|uniref:hypothetical protein n=1 Tax=Tritonibacter scottomollicae TaxID=483013 RepID=UPI001A9D4873|nr:hypothetical protein [Tritonibacter scottomollicae]